MVEFFDYNCGYCERALADLINLIEANPNIKIILKEYPILNDNSYDLAKLSLSAGLQGKYFEFHKKDLRKDIEFPKGGKCRKIVDIL